MTKSHLKISVIKMSTIRAITFFFNLNTIAVPYYLFTEKGAKELIRRIAFEFLRRVNEVADEEATECSNERLLKRIWF